MATELYDISVPAFLGGLAATAAFLEKGRAWADEHGIAHEDLLGARIYEDMAPLTSQIQRISDAAKLSAARLAGIEGPAMPDTETSFAELQARIAATVDFIKSVPREKIDAREDAEIVLKVPGGELKFAGRGYAITFALPNFYFHVTTAYAILRMKGVPVGKRDYLGGI